MGGWIKLHRSMLDWEWWEDQNTTRLWLTILLKANHEESRWRGQIIRPGQLITSVQSLSRASGLSERSVRTALDHLRATNEVTTKATNQNTLITVTKWAFFQGEDDNIDKPNGNQSDKRPTNDRQTTDKRPTTNKKEKNEKNEKKNIYTAVADRVIDYLNSCTGASYRHSETSRRHIIARLNENFTESDCKKVIDNKTAEWLDDPKMQKFLCPETLFGSKFEKYLNQQSRSGTNSFNASANIVIPMPGYMKDQIDGKEKELGEEFDWLKKYDK